MLDALHSWFLGLAMCKVFIYMQVDIANPRSGFYTRNSFLLAVCECSYTTFPIRANEVFLILSDPQLVMLLNNRHIVLRRLNKKHNKLATDIRYLQEVVNVFVVGMTGNILVCYSAWCSRSLKTVTNIFLVNLAVADILVLLICLPATVITDVMQSWFLGIIMCKLSVYLQRVSVFVSVLTLTSISVERYLAICHPLRYHGSYFKTKPIIAVIWIVSLATPSVDFYNMILVHDSEIPESLRPWLTVCGPRDENIEMEFNMFLVVVFFFIPLVIMSYTYGKIAVCIWSSTSRHNTMSQNLQKESAIEYLQVRRRTAKMLIVVVITFGLCYLPIYVLNIARYTNALDGLRGNRVAVLCMYWTARFLCYFNSAVNPVIYNFMSVKFRKQFKTACHGCYVHLRCCCCCFKKTRRYRRNLTHLHTLKR
ncbi:orexin/Hypocretin receptor type 1-like [Mya arenaria]|uniref:orexin/Hypocretin receptor type 1-like n=1 Tax=Mya arenaria TaxID=6604 RepID=UPI0022E9316B|nr:orexin/Hypocretin receptor type 1-like [Mya arenaria]